MSEVLKVADPSVMGALGGRLEVRVRVLLANGRIETRAYQSQLDGSAGEAWELEEE